MYAFMKVALISHGNLDHVLPYLSHMAGGGWEVHWLQIAPGNFAPPDGVTVHSCYKPGRDARGSASLKLAGYIASGKLAKKLLKSIAPDVVTAHYASSGGLVAWLSGFRPYVVTIHGGDLIDRYRRLVGRFILKRVLGAAAAVNPVCRHMSGIIESLGVRPERIEPLTFGIELDRFVYHPSDNPLSAGVKVICTRSLNKTLYDIPTVIRGVAEARRLGLDAELTLPAGGKFQSDFERLGDELGMGEAISFGGGYEMSELPEMLAQNTVYVSASIFDGASLSLMEAMAGGLFPVVSDIPANREWLQDGKTGLLFPTGDWKCLGRLLASLRQEVDMVRQGCADNRDAALARADRSKNMQRFMELLTEQVR
jgi:L-malate glycosyltransferase